MRRRWIVLMRRRQLQLSMVRARLYWLVMRVVGDSMVRARLYWLVMREVGDRF
jgi:hypothetical protein